ncbi:MAG: DUF3501 family protein [Proteobacteria bacterium]|nr:DUF3501 family protein [Pseudomonadota bacterium]
MREGGLDAPIRHPIDWRDPDFTDADKIEAELRHAAVLAKLGGIEETAFVRVGGETIRGACPRPTWSAPARPARPPSVQFIHFPFTDAQVATFRQGGAEIVAGFTHPEYAHMAVQPARFRSRLVAA